MSAHKSKIANFIPFSSQNYVISIHFNLKFHNFVDHFCFYVIQYNILDTSERLKMKIIVIKNNKVNFLKKFELKTFNSH